MDPGLAPGLSLLSDLTLEPLFPTFPTCGALNLPETHVKTNPSSLQLLLSGIFVTVTSKVTERTLLVSAVVTCHRGGMATSLLGDQMWLNQLQTKSMGVRQKDGVSG